MASVNFLKKYFENWAKAQAKVCGIHADTPCPARKHNFRSQIENFYQEIFAAPLFRCVVMRGNSPTIILSSSFADRFYFDFEKNFAKK